MAGGPEFDGQGMRRRDDRSDCEVGIWKTRLCGQSRGESIGNRGRRIAQETADGVPAKTLFFYQWVYPFGKEKEISPESTQERRSDAELEGHPNVKKRKIDGIEVETASVASQRGNR